MLCIFKLQHIHIIHIIFDYKAIIHKHAHKSNIICICNISSRWAGFLIRVFRSFISLYTHCICIDIDFTSSTPSFYVNHTLIHWDWIVLASRKNNHRRRPFHFADAISYKPSSVSGILNDAMKNNKRIERHSNCRRTPVHTTLNAIECAPKCLICYFKEIPAFIFNPYDNLHF